MTPRIGCIHSCHCRRVSRQQDRVTYSPWGKSLEYPRAFLFLFFFKTLKRIFCPVQTSVEHKVQPQGIEYIELAADKAAVEQWIGTDKLPLRFVDGPAGIKAVGIKIATGTIVLK